MKHILIADDHEITRRGIREILVEAYPDAEITEASSGGEVLDAVRADGLDLILLDIRMPGPPVIELLEQIREIEPHTPILVLTGLTEVEYVIQTMKAGANGLIHKHHATDELLLAIDQVMTGHMYLHSDSAIAIATDLHEQNPNLPHHQLSERELEVFRRIAVGRSVKSIAADLGVSGKTVATYLARIKAKTELSTPVEIARYALRNGIVD